MPADLIDAHHHLWKYSAEQYPWITGDMELLQRDFLVDDLKKVVHQAGITGVVTVQARQTLEETEWLLALAGQNDFMRGVVGWVPLAEEDVHYRLEQFSQFPKLKAVRHVLHDEADDLFMLRNDFNRGIAHLKEFNLAYDLLIFERHLPQTIEFVDRHPHQIFVLDHIAKPLIRDGALSPWKASILKLAERNNVYCKLSGMVTEADWTNWREKDLQPYFDIVIEAFGPERLMFGSDWPVVLVASSYQRWIQTVQHAVSALSENEQAQILGRAAKLVYRL
jgi:L-fuconolactonase